MSSPTPPGEREISARWQAALGATEACVPVARLAVADLTPSDSAHVAGCARCQTERRLWLEVDADEERPGEGAAVAWVAAETARRLSGGIPTVDTVQPRRPWRRWALSLGGLAVAAAGVVLMVRPPVPVVQPDGQPDVSRAATMEIVSPDGEVPVPPTELVWRPAANASEYEVRVTEVDGTEVWRAVTRDTRLALPESVVRVAQPGRTLEWTVAARGADGRAVAAPRTAAFRVALTAGVR